MRSHHSDSFVLFKICSECILVICCFFAAYYIRFYAGIPVWKGVPDLETYIAVIPILAISWALSVVLLRYYRPIRQKNFSLRQIIETMKTGFLCTLFFISLLYLYEENKYSRATFILFAFLLQAVLFLESLLLSKIASLLRKKEDYRKVIVVGSGEILSQTLDSLKDQAVEIIGVVPYGGDRPKLEGMNCYPMPNDWTEFLSQTKCDSVFIALPHRDYDFFDKYFHIISEQSVSVKIVPDLARFTRFMSKVEYLDLMPVISVHESSFSGGHRLLKRGMDILGSFVALILFMPLMLLAGVLVKLTSSGPMFYKQKRMGMDGRVFSIYKFRTMRTLSPEKTKHLWTTKNDTRVTWIGKFLRQTSLDELPQLLNVLRGDMSLVGPRPEQPYFVDQFRKEIPGYMLRHKVKAGITGWAQVNGWRGDSSIKHRIEHDLFYIQNWSIVFDIKILFMTVLKGFISPHAY